MVTFDEVTWPKTTEFTPMWGFLSDPETGESVAEVDFTSTEAGPDDITWSLSVDADGVFQIEAMDRKDRAIAEIKLQSFF